MYKCRIGFLFTARVFFTLTHTKSHDSVLLFSAHDTYRVRRRCTVTGFSINQLSVTCYCSSSLSRPSVPHAFLPLQIHRNQSPSISVHLLPYAYSYASNQRIFILSKFIDFYFSFYTPKSLHYCTIGSNGI